MSLPKYNYLSMDLLIYLSMFMSMDSFSLVVWDVMIHNSMVGLVFTTKELTHTHTSTHTPAHHTHLLQHIHKQTLPWTPLNCYILGKYCTHVGYYNYSQSQRSIWKFHPIRVENCVLQHHMMGISHVGLR